MEKIQIEPLHIFSISFPCISLNFLKIGNGKFSHFDRVGKFGNNELKVNWKLILRQFWNGDLGTKPHSLIFWNNWKSWALDKTPLKQY